MLDRIGGTPRLYRWLFVLGAVVMASPIVLSVSAYGTVSSYREWTTDLSRSIDSLTSVRGEAEASGDPRLPEYETALAGRTAQLERARSRLDRAQRHAALWWHANGRGPLLLAAGAALVLLGVRLRRFEQYGE
jgi:hypothetical protein